MVVEGLPDDLTQAMIDDLIARRQNKLKELGQINRGVPMAQIKTQRHEERLNDLREKLMLKMMEEKGFELDDITLELVEDRMGKEQDKPPRTSDGLVFADIECILDSNNTFIPILICYTRGQDKTIFHHWGTNCVDLFIQKLLQWAKEDKAKGVQEFHIFFHNLKGFDGVFIMNRLYKLNLKVTDVMGTGTKTLHFKHKNLIFKDSLSFLNMPLTHFTKTFGLTELKKGWLPQKFSKLENLHYYEPQHMNEDKKKECEDWHAEKVLKREVWNFQQEMLSYCESDVKLLKEGYLKFAEDTQRDAGFNPFTQCITIASTCHYFWRNYQKEPKTTAVESPHGWGRLKTNQSKIAMEWLYYEDTKLGGYKIKHTRNGGEQVIQVKRGRVKVDGYNASTKTIYEFHGCEFHACRKCKPNNRHVKTFHHPDRTVEEIYQATQTKTGLLKKAGYKVIEIWECDFKRELKQHQEMQNVVKKMTWVSPLDPRDAFYGGRTGKAKCYHKAEENKQILYENFTSLYPTINKYDTYPIGHPQIIVNPESQNIRDYFGIAKVDVLAPEKLLHPVLPVKLNAKLMFPPCVKCVEDQLERPWHEQMNLCNHTDEERVMRGTWCTPELEKAVRKGYKIQKNP